MTTRKYVKRREMTWEYAKGIDGVNTSQLFPAAMGAT
jgi:hypothetical protein